MNNMSCNLFKRFLIILMIKNKYKIVMQYKVFYC